MFDSFIKFQRLLAAEFTSMQQEFGFEIVNANQKMDKLQADLRSRISTLLGID
jgi:hypothetical protein